MGVGTRTGAYKLMVTSTHSPMPQSTLPRPIVGEQSSGVYGTNVVIIVALTIALIYSAIFVAALAHARSSYLDAHVG